MIIVGAKETLEIKLSKLVRKFCDYLRLNIELHIQKDEDEISEFFRRKGKETELKIYLF